MKRRVYDRQFKIEAVQLALSRDIAVSKTAQALHISAPTLYRWITEWERDKENAFPGRSSPVINTQYEISKLQKKVTYLEQERALLKKFQAFTIQAKNQVWVGDITYIPTASGFLYLAVFIDLFSRKTVGWAMDTNLRHILATSAFNQAYGREHPEKGLLVHTDQGSQYTSQQFTSLLERHDCIHSISRKGNPYDNAVVESFFKTLKRELVNDVPR